MSTTPDRPWSPYATGAGIGALEWFTFGTAQKVHALERRGSRSSR